MRVLLINPPALNTVIANNPPLIDEERGINPPLGLLYLASALRERGFEVQILDTQVEEMDYEKLDRWLKNKEFEVVGITCMTLTLPDVLRTVRVVKRRIPQAKIVLGGPHPHIYPRETLALKEVDYVVRGEGEIVFPELLQKIERGEDPEDIPGIGWKKEGEIKVNPFSGYIDNLDSLPFPARELTPYERYFSALTPLRPVTTMITSRGCPYSCTFCDRPHLGRKFRARSAENVVREMESCEKMGIREILIYDDTFNVDRRRVVEICERKKDRGLKILWDARLRVDIFDEELAEKMKEAGCQRVHFGVEAGTEKILKKLKKGITLEDARRAFEIARRVGIKTLAYFMIGAPGETREDILATLRFALSLQADYTHVTILTPFPSTQIYREGLEKNIIPDFWGEFARDPGRGVEIHYWEEILSERELQELIKIFYRRFYLRPSFILREIFRIRTLSGLVLRIKGAWGVLSGKGFYKTS